jgi:hypothetical protein
VGIFKSVLLGCTAVLAAGAAALAQDPAPVSCSREAFATVVDDAAAALRDLNAGNKPQFQTLLRQLKERRGWSEDEFLKQAAPFVKDDQIEVYDKTSSQLLADISSMGQEGSEAKTPDCAMLDELNRAMKELVAAQTSKWAYMFDKLKAELAR